MGDPFDLVQGVLCPLRSQRGEGMDDGCDRSARRRGSARGELTRWSASETLRVVQTAWNAERGGRGLQRCPEALIRPGSPSERPACQAPAVPEAAEMGEGLLSHAS